MQGSLDDYLKLHAKPNTTLAQKQSREYDFSAVDKLDSDRDGYNQDLIAVNQPSTYDEDSFEAARPNGYQQSLNGSNAPPKELQAYCSKTYTPTAP